MGLVLIPVAGLVTGADFTVRPPGTDWHEDRADNEERVEHDEADDCGREDRDGFSSGNGCPFGKSRFVLEGILTGKTN